MTVIHFFTICLYFVVLFGLNLVQTRIIYVTPGDAALCPKDSSPCHTLDWYNKNGSFMTNNTEVRFLNGTHRLSTTIAHIIDCYNLTITGFQNPSSHDQSHNATGKMQPISQIACTSIASSSSGFVFKNATGINIQNIGFDSCRVVLNIPECDLGLSAALHFWQGANITVHNVVINNTKGCGLHTDNVFGLISVSESSFLGAMETNKGLLISNANFWFGHHQRAECRQECSKVPAILTITSSQFSDGQINASGLEIIVSCPNVSVVIENVTIKNNKGKDGGNLALSVTDFGLTTNKSTINISDSRIEYGRAKRGGGMRIWTRSAPSNNSTCTDTSHHKLLSVYNTTFHSNFAHHTGGAVHIMHFQSGGYDCTVKNIVFSSCTFKNNSGNSAVMEVTYHLILTEYSSPPLYLTFNDCEFLNNSALSEKKATLNIIMTHIMLSNCTFSGSNGTALSLRKSNLNICKINHFINNHGAYGGALKICEGSFVFLHNNSQIWFINNSALMGGAIFVQQTCFDTASACVFQPSMPETTVDVLGKLLKVNFVNNSAITAGDAVFGGSLSFCFTIAKYIHNGSSSFFNFLHILYKVFNVTGQSGSSWISSYPQGVCFCVVGETMPHYFCQTDHSVIEAYPGQRFKVSAVTVGQLNGTTMGRVQASLNEERYSHQLVTHGGRRYNNCCIPLAYTLLTNQSSVTVVLRPSVETYIKAIEVNFTVHLLDCPLGFQLTLISEGQYKCDCSTLFSLTLVTCDISTQSIQVPAESATVWFGCAVFGSDSVHGNESTCDTLVVSQDCDYYCSPNSRNVNITNIDEQCLSGRTGILCGACKPGLSRILGSYYECKPCSNKTLMAYILMYLLSAVFIVFLVAALNLTVTEGTINGFIIYTTVVYRSHEYFFRIHRNQMSQPLWTFMAWLNLDLGVDNMCAYDGMTGYQHIWLTFGYAFYLLIIQAVIVLLSHRFVFFTRLFGKNMLKVLATLLLLTHSLIIYSCFHTFNYAYLQQSTSDTTIHVWYYDGNIPYFGVKHTLLFIVAVIVSLVTLFFMFSLLFIQCLQKCSGYWCLRWIERLRPFFETYTGPCNDNYRFWPGLIYVLRTVLCGISMYLGSAETRLRHIKMILISAFCMVIICLACIFPHGVYKKWPLNVLEFSFLLNLCILCIFLGFTKYGRIAILFSMSIMMLTFFGILIYHLCRQIKGTRCWIVIEKWLSVSAQKLHRQKLSKENEEVELLLPQPLPAVVQFRDYREVLLDD